MKEDIEKIIYYGTLAPSGDNCQPWRFEVKGDEISIFNLPEKDLSVYNFNKMAAFISHGALIENIVVAAKNFGYSPEVSLFPDQNNPDLVAKVKLSKNNSPADELFGVIEKRETNRKNFETKELTGEENELLKSSAKELSFGEIKLNKNREELEKLANLLGLNERLVFEVKQMHYFFFKHINWDRKEDGMPIGTLELNKPQEIMFKIFKHWPILSLVNKIGFSKIIGKENAKIHAASGAIGVIVLPSTKNKEDFVKVGRLLERVWLKATKLNLGFQLMTGLSFLKERFDNNNFEYFNAKQKNDIIKTSKEIAQIFDLSDKDIFIPFRVGHSEKASTNCLRQEPAIKFTA